MQRLDEHIALVATLCIGTHRTSEGKMCAEDRHMDVELRKAEEALSIALW